MNIKKIILVIVTLIGMKANAGLKNYDCNSPRPEMSGSHNMVLFGDPKDKIYTYHLPLFKGDVNGESGHVFMHVYQGLWEVDLDNLTIGEYYKKFHLEKTDANPFPFFSISPRGKKFKVPEMICNNLFMTEVISAYGHVEGNPEFPSPQMLIDKLSTLKVNKILFARKFDGQAMDELTYIVFGTNNQLYMAHYLTDDENSFDQIVAIEFESRDLKKSILSEGVALVTLPIELNKNLKEVTKSIGKNNKFALSTKPLGKAFRINFKGQIYKIMVNGEVYFNNNEDLQVFH